jgi:glycopeptide antibiotics resistance protein
LRAPARRQGGGSLARDLALLAALAAILSLTLVPMDDPHEVRLVPLSDIGDAFTPSLDTSLLVGDVLNVALFVPLGIALRLRQLPLGRAVLAALALSATVELAQATVVSGRTTSVDDLLLNTLGAAFGHVLASLLVPKGR